MPRFLPAKLKPQSKNLLIVLDFPHIGGAERVALQIASHIDANRFCPIVVAPHKGILYRELENNGVQTHLIDLDGLKRTCRFVAPMFNAIKELVQLIKRENIDVVHANSLWALKFCTIASLITGVPTVAMIHAYPKIHSRPKRMFHLLTRRFCYGRARKLIAVSSALKDALVVDKASPSKVIVIPNGVEAESLVQSPKQPTGQVKTILTVGRLHPGKGQQLFLKAAAIVHEKLPDTAFVVAGEECPTSLENLGFKEKLVQLANELGLSDCVQFVGYTSNLRELYRRCSVVVVASFEETFGLVALEAMAAGRPVVASRIPGITELVDDEKTGLLFQPGDPEDLARKVIRLLSDDGLRADLCGRALALAKAKYTLESTIERVHSVYEAIIAER